VEAEQRELGVHRGEIWPWEENLEMRTERDKVGKVVLKARADVSHSHLLGGSYQAFWVGPDAWSCVSGGTSAFSLN
jgi:sarcosine oxidase gamma subunit